jgi:hypothetical protein
MQGATIMAEEQYVTYDKYRADLADFRSDMARFREEIRSDLSGMKIEIAHLKTEMYSLHNKTIIWLFGIVTAAVLALKLIP